MAKINAERLQQIYDAAVADGVTGTVTFTETIKVSKVTQSSFDGHKVINTPDIEWGKCRLSQKAQRLMEMDDRLPSDMDGKSVKVTFGVYPPTSETGRITCNALGCEFDLSMEQELQKRVVNKLASTMMRLGFGAAIDRQEPKVTEEPVKDESPAGDIE